MKQSIVEYLTKLATETENSDLQTAAQLLAIGFELEDGSNETVDLVQLFAEHLETAPLVNIKKSTPFDDYVTMITKKGYFTGTTPGSFEYEERLNKAKSKWDENQEKKKEAAVELKTQGNEKFKEGDYEASIELYSQAIKLDPQNPTYYSNRGLAYSKLSQYDSAIDDYNSSLSFDDTQVKIYVRLGNCYNQIDRKDDAIKTYKRGLVVDPSNADLQGNINILVQEKMRAAQAAQGAQGPNFDLAELMNNPAVAENLNSMSGLLNNPNFMQMAQSMMQDPNFQNMMSGMMDPSAFGQGPGTQ